MAFWKKAGRLFVVLFIVALMATPLAFAKPGKGKGKALGRSKGHFGAPEAGIVLLVGTGLASVGFYALRKRK